MNVFQKYAFYYDALYADKNYQEEIDYIQKLIQKYSKNLCNNILDLGCGTGKHAALLAKKGYKIKGIDLSKQMINLAQKNFKHKNLSFMSGDIRDFKFNQNFDVVLSLFHVISYLTTDKDLTKVFTNVAKHLNKYGIFIFDCWYGPAVLDNKPEIRIKRLQKNNFKLTRIAEPKTYRDKNIVDVNYQIFIKNIKKNFIEDFEEKHVMRYLFNNEIQKFLSDNGFKLIVAEEWLSGKKPNEKTWSVTFVCEKI
ncbi:methyltransferase domain-containing protein [Candidatus Dependentiae bacterium]|nr:methyltransferase domain-containing protein [Candidatus Dependentiae bacterium]